MTPLYTKLALFLLSQGFFFAAWGRSNWLVSLTTGCVAIVSTVFLAKEIYEEFIVAPESAIVADTPACAGPDADWAHAKQENTCYAIRAYLRRHGDSQCYVVELAAGRRDGLCQAYDAEQARLETERQRREAEEQARLEAERQQRQAAERARLEAERQQRQAAERARLEAERQRREAMGASPPRLRPAIPAPQIANTAPAPVQSTAAVDAQRRFACRTDDGAEGVSFAEKCWPLTTTKIEAGDIPYEVRRQITDAAPLAGLAGLRGLDLDNTQVSDLTPLQGLTGLQVLYMFRTQVSDLTPLAGLAGLRKLYLPSTQVSDLTPLQSMTGLQVLSLPSTQVSDLTPLQAMTGLQRLSLSHTQVSDLTPLQGLTRLQRLSLFNTQVSDLTPLQAMTALQVLNLSDTQVSDLTPLQGITGLQGLYLSNTQVSDLTPLQGMTGLHWFWTPDGGQHGGPRDTPENRADVARAIRTWRPAGR